MLISCGYCGLYHNRGETCPKRYKAKRKPKEINEIIKFRSSRAWKNKREEIKKRDLFLCQICLLEKYNTERKYNYKNLEVHHIYKLSEYFQFRLNDGFLITLCNFHHKMADSGKIPATELLKIIDSM
jgi:5-methylcytosine-specific restriction protein A